MRVKTLERDGSRKVLLVYPTTLDEYRQALATIASDEPVALGLQLLRLVGGPEPYG